MWKILVILCNVSVVLMNENSRFLNATCTASEYGTFNNTICFVKNGLLTAGGTLTRSLVNPKLNHKLFIKNGKTYRQIIRFPPVDVCSYTDGKSFNPFAKMLVDFLRLYAPQAVQKCPWKGFVGVTTLSLEKTKLVSLFPSGNYRHIVGYSDEKDEKIFSVDYYSILFTSIKANN